MQLSVVANVAGTGSRGYGDSHHREHLLCVLGDLATPATAAGCPNQAYMAQVPRGMASCFLGKP